MASTSTQQPRRALVVYGSETGNAQDVAEELGRLAVRLRFETQVAELDAVTLVCQTSHCFSAQRLIACRNNCCSTTLSSLPSPPVARGTCRRIVKHSGGLSVVQDCGQDVCSRCSLPPSDSETLRIQSTTGHIANCITAWSDWEHSPSVTEARATNSNRRGRYSSFFPFTSAIMTPCQETFVLLSSCSSTACF
jgi:hypothetical protein